MKKIYTTCAATILAFAINAQTVSTFETLSVPTDSFIAPTAYTNGYFDNGNARFSSVWDTAWGGFWDKGFAPSSKTDKTTPGSANIYSASTGTGFSSANYAIGKGGATLTLLGNAAGKAVKGLYVTNSTYAYFSLKNGDSFAKKFGGSSGNDPDFFLLTVKGFSNGNPKNDSVNFYLADFRFADNNQDYILDTWAWLDLQPLGDVDSLIFKLSSSDNDPLYGMNTPSFFALDNFTTSDGVSAISTLAAINIKAFPNPVTKGSQINIALQENNHATVILTDLSGRIVYTQNIFDTNTTSVSTANLSSGTYLLTIRNTQGIGTSKIIIE